MATINLDKFEDAKPVVKETTVPKSRMVDLSFFQNTDVKEESSDIVERSVLGTGRDYFNNKLAKLGEFDQDDKTTFGGIVRQFAIGAVNSALLDAPQLFAGEEGFNQLRSESKAERIARGVGTMAGFVSPGSLTNILFKGGRRVGGKLFVKSVKKGVIKNTQRARNIGIKTAKNIAGIGAIETAKSGIDIAVGESDATAIEKTARIGGAVILGGVFGVAEAKLFPVMAAGAKKFADAIKKESEVLARTATGQMTKAAEQEVAKITAKTQELINIKHYKKAYKHINDNYNGETRVNYIRTLKNVRKANKTQQKQVIRDKRLRITEQPKAKVIGPRGENQFIIKDTKSSPITKDTTLEKTIVENTADMLPIARLRDVIGPVQEVKFATWDRLPVLQTIVRSGLKAVESGGAYISQQGAGGKALVQQLLRKRDYAGKRSGEVLSEYELNKKLKLSALEMKTFPDFIEGRRSAISHNQNNLGIWFRTVMKEAQGEYVENGVTDKLRQNYFPHFLANNYTSKKAVKEILQAATDRGEFKTINEARAAFKSWKEFLKTKKLNKQVIDLAIKGNEKLSKDQRLNEQQIIDKLNSIGKQIDNYRFGNAEMGRTLNLPFWDPNINRVIPRYIINAQERIADAKFLGITGVNDPAKSKMVQALLKRISDDGGDYDAAHLLFQREMGLETGEVLLGARIFGAGMKAIGKEVDVQTVSKTWSKNIRAFQIVSKLGFGTTVANATQPTNTAIRTGFINTVKSYRQAYDKKTHDFGGIQITGKEFALRTGATVEAIMNSVIAEATGGGTGFANTYLRSIGFTAVERMNRTVAANAGALYAKRLGENLVKRNGAKGRIANYKLNQTKRELRRLGLSPEKIAHNHGKLDYDDLIKAGKRISDETQFITSPLDVPLPFSSPEGKVLFQFKNFAFKQAKFFKNAILDEVGKGNYKPLMTAMVAMPTIGEGAANVRAILAGRYSDRKKKKLLSKSRLIENFAAVGGAGIWYDAYVAATYGRGIGFFVGPTGSDAVKIIDLATSSKFSSGSIERAQRSPELKAEETAKFMARQVPYVGPNLRRNIMMNKNDKGAGVTGKIVQSLYPENQTGLTKVLQYPFIATDAVIEAEWFK